MKRARSPQEIERIRESILDQALDIIVHQGLDGLTMRTLAARTNMTAPNLYNYYSGKDELYLSIVVKGFEMLYGALEGACAKHADKTARAKAMIQAYVDFGLNQPRYYDIMFTLPTPKHNDYIGTPHEALSATEYRISMKIIDLVGTVVNDIFEDNGDADILQRRIIQVWGLLHGMISLHNSTVVSYVADNINHVYSDIINELADMVTLLGVSDKS